MLTWAWSPDWSAEGLPLHVMRSGGSCQPHHHPFHELVVVASGTGRHADADGEVPLRGGDVLLLHPHAWHAYPDGERLRVYNCVFQPEVLAAHPALLADLGPAAGLLARRHPRPASVAPLHLHASEPQRRELAHGLEGMIAEQRGRAPGWRALLVAGLVQALVQLSRLRSPEAERSSLPSDAAIDAVTAWLAGRFSEPMISLSAMARRFGLSPGYLSRRFAGRTGLGVVAYVHQLRLEEACRMLVRDDATVTAVALAVGYDDPAYFTRLFTRLVGCPPRAYRQRNA